MRRLNRSFLAGLVCGLMLCLCLFGAVGCSSDSRGITAINAEQSSLTTTKAFAKTHVEKYPEEKTSVDDFYSSWQGRIDKEKTAAGSP